MTYIRSGGSLVVRKATSTQTDVVAATFAVHARRLIVATAHYTTKTKRIITASDTVAVMDSSRKIIEEPELATKDALESFRLAELRLKQNYSFVAVKESYNNPIFEEIAEIILTSWQQRIDFESPPMLHDAVCQVYLDGRYLCLNAEAAATVAQAQQMQLETRLAIYQNSLFPPRVSHTLRIKVKVREALNDTNRIGRIVVVKPATFKIDGHSRLVYETASVGNVKALLV